MSRTIFKWIAGILLAVGVIAGGRYLQDSGLLRQYTGINLDNYTFTRLVFGSSSRRAIEDNKETVTYSFYKELPDGLYLCWCEFGRCSCGIHEQ